MEPQSTIAVCGATGKQGGAVMEALLADGRWSVIALSRDVESPRARALAGRGVAVRKADLQDAASLREAIAGAAAVYGVTTPLMPSGKIDTGREREQGFHIADACVANGIGHLVLSTVMIVDDEQRKVPYIKAKLDVEDYVKKLGVPHTFLRPGSFTDEIGGEYLPVKKGVITGMAANDAKIPYVACRDIGRAAAMAFAEPEKFKGRALNLISDFVSGDELAALLGRLYGRRFKHKAPPMLLMYVFAREWIFLRRLFERWGREPHPPALLEGIAETRRLLPDALTFEQFLIAANPDTTRW